MPFTIVHDDITRLSVDAIVNPTNAYFSGKGGTDGAIYRVAGPWLRVALAMKRPLAVGDAIITEGFELPARYIIHTRGPVWEGGEDGEAEDLVRCYNNCLKLAWKSGCQSVAFPLISGGTFGFPNDDALQIAKDTINSFLRTNDMDVFLVIFMQHTFNLSKNLFADVSEYVAANLYRVADVAYSLDPEGSYGLNSSAHYSADPVTLDLAEMLRHKSETFSCMLARLVDECGKTAPDIYKKARVTKSVYSKIMANIHYKPSKLTAVAFALALQLPWEELKELVESAGYSMTRTNKFDIVIEYFVRNKKYSIDEINAVLYELDPELPLIGC